MVEGAQDEGFDDPAAMTPEERAEWQRERDAEQRLALVPGGSFPDEGALRMALGVPEGSTIPPGNPEGLVPLARAALARNKQQMLATMVQMGLQRIVIESGRLNASMRFHVDTSSAANEDRGSQFDLRNTIKAGARGGFGPWGAEAKVQNTIGYVTTERSQTSEEINTELDLDSGVELIFRTDYVPLDRLAGGRERERIRVNALNPEAEAQRIQQARGAREERRQTERTARRGELDAALRTPASHPPADSTISPPAAGEQPEQTEETPSEEAHGQTDGSPPPAESETGSVGDTEQASAADGRDTASSEASPADAGGTPEASE
jgi:hypothetical protein